MLMKDLVGRINTELKKITSFSGLTSFDYLENKLFLRELEKICIRYQNSDDEAVFDEQNPIVKLLADRSLLSKRIKEAKIPRSNEIAHIITPADHLSQTIAKTLVVINPVRPADINQAKNQYLSPDLPLTRPQDDYFDLTKLASIMLHTIAKIPADEPAIDTKIYLASLRSYRDLVEFLTPYANAKEPVKITREELGKFLQHTKARWEGIYDTGSSYKSNPNTRANIAYSLLSNALMLADTYANLDYVGNDPDKWIMHAPVALKDKSGKIIPPNQRHLNYIAGLKEFDDIKFDKVVDELGKKHGRAVYNFTKVSELFTTDDLHNRLVMVKLVRLYIKDREENRSTLFTKGDKVPAAYWLIDHLLNKTNLNNFPNEIPKEYVYSFEHGELKKFKPLIAEIAKIALAQKETVELKKVAP